MYRRLVLALQVVFGWLTLALRGRLVVAALAAVLLVGGGSAVAAAATPGRIFNLTPTVQPTQAQEPNGDNNDGQHCDGTPTATPAAAGQNCADNDGQKGTGQQGDGQNDGQNGDD